MPVITLANHTINYTVRYQKRKTISLKIVAANALAISAPIGIPNSQLEQLIQAKAGWIIKKINQLQQLAENPCNNTLTDGSIFLLQGQELTVQLTISDGSQSTVVQAGVGLHVCASSHAQAAICLKAWYKQQAQSILTRRTAKWSKVVGAAPNAIAIKEQRTRWGSCSSLGNINYNWRIVMAPAAVIDYLVVHELCHLQAPNHSHHFWQLVAAVLPDWRQSRLWLKQNGTVLLRPLSEDV